MEYCRTGGIPHKKNFMIFCTLHLLPVLKWLCLLAWWWSISRPKHVALNKSTFVLVKETLFWQSVNYKVYILPIIIIICWFLWFLGKGEEVRWFRGTCCVFARDLPVRTEKSDRLLAELPVIRSENVKFPNTLLFYTTNPVKFKRKHLVDKSP